MDFFARQDSARRSTSLLLAQFSLAVIGTILLVYFIPIVAWFFYKGSPDTGAQQFQWWYPELFLGVCGGTLLIVFGGALFKVAELRRGGGVSVAAMLGGREIPPNTDDFFERRLRNVVEEMAIASGVPVPPVFVMSQEMGVNAFAAGFSLNDAVVAVTYGTMTGLTRDELQGVVAHEFSHILNKDMAINIKLMGFLHGLLIIGLTGRIIMEFVGYGSHRRRDKESGQITFVILIAGLTLMVVGFTGFFFCKLIKASISRHRERLADASAVQFTRDPAGLASALKKIGGLAEGSRIRSPKAEEASHMFFGNALKGGMFNTHPPLIQRVKWLDPHFNGEFPNVTYDDLRKQLAQFEGAPKREEKKDGFADIFTDPMKATVAAAAVDAFAKPAPPPSTPHQILESVGQPMEHHAEHARELIASIPDAVRMHTSDAYGARMLVYFLLLDRDASIRTKQMSHIQEMAEPQVYDTLIAAEPKIDVIPAEQRLPIIDLAIPALRFLSEGQYRAFIQIVNALIEADGRVDVFEYALKRVLTNALGPMFDGAVRRPAANYYAIRGLAKETALLLSVLARKGHESEAEATRAFSAAVETINDPRAEFVMVDEQFCTWEQLDAALDKLNEGSAQIKKLVLAAALTCLMHDREITVEEVELFRAIATTLDCPVPPWVAPMQLEEA